MTNKEEFDKLSIKSVGILNRYFSQVLCQIFTIRFCPESIMQAALTKICGIW